MCGCECLSVCKHASLSVCVCVCEGKDALLSLKSWRWGTGEVGEATQCFNPRTSHPFQWKKEIERMKKNRERRKRENECVSRGAPWGCRQSIWRGRLLYTSDPGPMRREHPLHFQCKCHFILLSIFLETTTETHQVPLHPQIYIIYYYSFFLRILKEIHKTSFWSFLT